MSVTGTQIRRECGRILRENDNDLYWDVLISSGAVTASITDSVNLRSTRFTAQAFQDRYVRESDGTGAAPDGEKVYARTLTPSSGVLTVSPDFTAANAANDEMELWKIDPDDIDRARDRALTQLCSRWRLVPLSYALDADFLVDAIGDTTPTHWVGSISATPTITTRSGMERFSERVLRLETGDVNAYAGQTINVRGDEGWVVRALVQADAGTASIVVRDLTNNAAITLTAAPRATWSGEAFQVIGATFTTPTTCEQISIRLTGTTGADDLYWANISAYPQQARDFVLPTRVAGDRFVGEFVEVWGDDWPEQQITALWQQPRLIDVGGGQVRAHLDTWGWGGHTLYWKEYAPYAALQTVYNTAAGRRTGDAATTDCPLEYAAYATLYMREPERFRKDWLRVKAQYEARPYVRFQRELGVYA